MDHDGERDPAEDEPRATIARLRAELAAVQERAAQELARARAAFAAELERKDRELEAFSYSVSHDLRAPLRSIDGFSLAVLEDHAERLDQQGQDYLRRVRAAAQRMGALIDDLLVLSRVGRAELQRERVDLSKIARAVLQDLRRGEPERHVRDAIEPELRAVADRRLLELALQHLLQNAWKFSSRRPEAEIAVGAVTGTKDAYFVRDNGVGFEAALAGKLFRPFQRLHRETEFPGRGIGLAVVHRVIDRHGGRVWAESTAGAGATFYFTLPGDGRAVA